MVVPPPDTRGQEFDFAWTKGNDGPEALRNIEVHRKELRKYLRSIRRPIPKFLQEEFDDALPPPPDPALIDLDVRILRFLVDQEKRGLAMKARYIYDTFQDVRVSMIGDRLLTLEESGYIKATVISKQYVAGSLYLEMDIHGVTDKGRKALEL